MVTRRQFMCSAAAVASAPFSLNAKDVEVAEESYADAVAKIWHTTKQPISDRLLLKRDLVRYATLAPSSHNTQCWQFKIEEQAILILPDFTRRCPAVDPDDHHLFVSLGCATENLMQAALANGLHAEIQPYDQANVDNQTNDDKATNAISIALEPTKVIASPLFQAITQRQCTRGLYDGVALTNEELNLLEIAGTGDGVHILLHTEKQAMENILAYVLEANSAQMQNNAFVAELKSWIRFSSEEAIRTGDGLYTATSGNQSLPRWFASPMFDLFFNSNSENHRYVSQIRSSAGIAIFVSDMNDRAHWLEVGRCYERFALQATALGIRNAFLNQPVEVAKVRQQFARYLDLDDGLGDALGDGAAKGSRPDLIVRFGRGSKMLQSLRRPVESVLI